jgi:ribosome maturation factor RimP
MDLVELIGDIAKKQIDNEEIFLVDVVVKGKTGNQKIQVFIDGDQSVDIDECSKISRRLSDELEERNLIEGKYVMEVSSPGADRPLKYVRQYPKHVGRELEIVTRNNKSYQGILIGVVDNSIELSISSGKVKNELKSDTLKLSIDEIDKARVVVRV